MANPAPGFQRDPSHSIIVVAHRPTVTVRAGNTVIANSGNALELREADYPPVLYIPFEDIDFGALEKSETHTHCPFKGDASYWSLSGQPDAVKDVMWAYQEPYDELLAIRNHAAFYPGKVTIEA